MENLEGHGAARRTDPATSHDAAALVKVSKLHRIILTSLRYSDCAVSEIANANDLPRDSLSPRMKFLVDNGLVEDTGGTRIPIGMRGHRPQTVWRLTEKGKRYTTQGEASAHKSA